MRREARSSWTLILGITVATLVLGLVWALAPEEALGLLLLAAGATTLAVYLALYAIVRRRHWGS